MEREILFRGQTRKKGEKVRLDGTPVDSNWVYGGVAQFNEERAIIYQTKPEFHKFAVYAKTLGQFTGLTDKNGKKIFEGDIIKFINGRLLDVRFNGETLQWELTDVGVPDWKVNHLHNTLPLSELEVETCYGEMTSEIVGNIHDNPELLKDDGISSDGYYPYCKECNARPENSKMTKYCPNCDTKTK